MPQTTVTKIFGFEAAHHLPNYKGPCKDMHGHSYKLEVTVSGFKIYREDPYPGMICDFTDLKEIVNKQIINKLDHKYLNNVLPNVTTAEKMVKWMWIQLQPYFVLKRIRLYETATSYATIEED